MAVMNAVQVAEVARARRTNRRPQHTFQLRHQPWQIQPFMIAPVLPGETMKSLLVQARVVTDPIVNPLIGWWFEQYFFYVKHRDLTDRDKFQEMVLDPSWDAATQGFGASSDWQTYYFGGSGFINWTEACLERVTDEFFRNEGEAWDGYLIDGMPIASISRQDWADSAVNAADVTSVDVDVDANADSTIMASEVEAAMQQWQLLRDSGLTQMSYEDYLQSYGVRPTTTEIHKPELVRYLREWTYPTNTVDPSDGTPSSAASWSIADRADKDRFFKEPGFLFGVAVVRPKVYLSSQIGSAVGAMNDVWSWLPSMLTNDPRASMKHFEIGTGPLPGNADANGYWFDVRDLLMYGDQFVNFDVAASDAGMVALPTTALQKRYPTEAMAKALFVDSAGTKFLVRSDGVVSLTIATQQKDTTYQT